MSHIITHLLRSRYPKGLFLGVILLISVAPFGSLGSLQAHAASNNAASAPLALVFNDDNTPAGCDDGCAAAAAHALTNSPWHFAVKFVGPKGVPLTKQLLQSAAIYVQPGGGDSLDATYAEIKDYAPLIREYVRSGGRYLGLCMGAFMAGANPGLNLLTPDDVDGYTPPGGNQDDPIIVNVSWRGHPRQLYFQGGAYFTGHTTAKDVVLARYIEQGKAQGPVAVMIRPYGKGKVAISGPHPEAPQAWFDDSKLPAPPGLNVDLVNDLLDSVMH
ncbi:BPL-N domain-containing protein [Ktedonosporobacter rubrisoli]|nr:BPL-N domain-containing protein [Ktedonosporobacter rubrisoli]